MTHTDKRFFTQGTLLVLALLGLNINGVLAQGKPKEPPLPVFPGKDGRLEYTPDALGNRIPDFSYAGYKAGNESLPDVPVKVVVPLKSGDATARIQSAIDYVSSLPLNKSGFRGAVLLQKGLYQVDGALQIKASGVVLRGSGMDDKGTIVLGAGVSRETLIRVYGKADRKLSPEVKIADAYVPVNSFKVSISNPKGFKVGDYVQIRRPSTKAWIEKLGTATFGGSSTLGWKLGQRDIVWDRKVVAISGSVLHLDAPISTALDSAYGGAMIAKYEWPGRIENVGIENLQLQSAFNKDNPKDEDHRWMAITLESVSDAWVRQVIFQHFAGSAVMALETAKRVTVEDCKSFHPVSEIGGQRRYTFYTLGQQTLFQRLYAENGYHDFAVGNCAPGPNAFVECVSYLPHSFSGTIDSWASGVLFDIVNVVGEALSYKNRGQDGQGAGWTAANSVFWQCTAGRVDNFAPPTAQNWAFGTWAQYQGDGFWAMSDEHIRPRSLYYAQLKDRLGDKVNSRIQLVEIGSEASSSPTVDVAQALIRQSVKPAPQLKDLIDTAPARNPVSLQVRGVKTIDQIGVKNPSALPKAADLRIENGVLVRGDQMLSGRTRDVRWWRGTLRPSGLRDATPHITRFAPGRTGLGYTDDLDSMTDSLKSANIIAIDHNYGLWYERRRDDHVRVKRLDGEVWAPFYEQPFARSGQGSAWDGLSKYDLTKYNKWYWNRLKRYADLADQKGLVLIHQNYFQHNIIEAGAHYADFPWRPVNNINNTGFPEPVPYAGDKRVFMSEQFYDISHPVRRELHRAYIRQCLNNFKDNSGVIQLVSAEYTGPLHFVQFWLDTIKEWEKETGKNALVGLSTTKDVQDAILADKDRASVVDIIDIRYWHYQNDDRTYEPKGGQNLAPRQHARLLKPKGSSFEQIYRAVSEYREKHPEKAVIYSGDNSEGNGWAIFMAGGSMPTLPALDKSFLKDAVGMRPRRSSEKQYLLADEGQAYILYAAGTTQLDLSKVSGSFKVRHINARTGELQKSAETVKGGSTVTLYTTSDSPEILWISKN